MIAVHTLESWLPHRDSEGWKHDLDGIGSDILEDNLGGEAEEAMGQITGTPNNGDVAEKGEPKTVRAAQRWFSDLQVIDKITRDNDPLLQPVFTTQIYLDRYIFRETYKGSCEVDYPCLRREVMAWKMVLEG